MVLPFISDQYFTNKRKMLEIYNNYPLYNLVPVNYSKWVKSTIINNLIKYLIKLNNFSYFRTTMRVTISIMFSLQILIIMVYLRRNRMVSIFMYFPAMESFISTFYFYFIIVFALLFVCSLLLLLCAVDLTTNALNP